MHLHKTIGSGVRALSIACMFVLLLAGAVLAQQETGQISGTVKDQSGAVIPNATVMVKNISTNAERTITTGPDGSYVVTNLLPATYSVTINLTGFNAATKQIVVNVGTASAADFTLTVGAAPTTVVVSEQAAPVNTETQTLSTVVTTRQVLQLPTLTRNPYDLVAVSGNITPIDPRDIANGSNRGVGFNINGQRSSSTDILLDGSDNNDTFTAALGQSIPLDSVQEFSVVTSDFTAEYGRAAGGVVNVATKSGTNEWHGTAYEFNRVSRLSSNTFDNNANGVPKSTFVRNQFGWSLGGPAIKDKLFFFTNTEWFRIRSNAISTAMVPTPALIASAAPVTQQFFAAYGQLKPDVTFGPVTNNGFQQVFYRVAADAGGGLPENEWMSVERVDFVLSPKTSMYGRYAVDHSTQFPGTLFESPFAGFDTGQLQLNQNGLFSITHTFTPRLVSQSKVVFNRLNLLQPLGSQPAIPSLYLASASVASQINGVRVALPGYAPFSPGQAIPFGGPQNLGQLYEDVSWSHKTHTFRFGGQYIYIRDNRAFGAYQEAVEQFGGNVNQGIANLLAGQLLTFESAVNPQGHFPGQTVTLPVGSPDFTRSNRYHDFAFYGQDSWRVVPRFTLNLGLRWDYFGVQHNKNPFLDSNYYLGPGSTLDQQIASGSVQLAPSSPIGSLWNKDHDNFGPRVGFAWDATGNGRTTLRGGWGISYERNFGNVTFNVIQNPPNYAVITLNSADAGTIPLSISNLGPLAGTSGTVVLPRTQLRAVDPNIETGRVQTWSLAVEREVVRNTVVSLEYSGSRGRDLYAIDRLNLAGSGFLLLGDPNPTDRLNNKYSVMNFRTNGGFSNYHAGIAELRSNDLFHTGIQFRTNYTYSHALDNISTTFSELSNDFNLGLLDYHNPRLDYGSADFDIRHRVSVSGIWDIPYRSTAGGGLARQVLGGWTLAPLFSAHTGAPFSIWDCSNQNFMCSRMLLADPNIQIKVDGNPSPVLPPLAGGNTFNVLDLTSQLALAGTYANPVTGNSDFGPFPSNMSSRNMFRQPGVWFFDMGVYKNFRLWKEGTAIQFRSEFYNIFNHSNLYADIGSADISSTTYIPGYYGLRGNIGERRNIQFALKFIF